MNPFNLDASGKGKLEWASAESASEQEARLKEEALAAADERRRNWWTFVAYLLALVVSGVVGVLLIFAGGTPERERYGATLLTAIVSGAAGFLSGRASKSK